MTNRLLLFVAIILSCGIANAQTVLTLRPGPTDGKDAAIEQYQYPNSPDGNDENFIANAWTSGGNYLTQRSLVSFNLSSIPGNAIIDSAFLSLYCNTTSGHTQRQSWYPGSPYSTNDAYLQRITSSWSENTVTWNNQPTTTATNQVALLPSTSATQDYLDINVTALVKDMIQYSSSSDGFMLRLQDETTYRSLIFASSDHPDSTKRPKLVVNYHIPTGIENIASDVQPLLIAPNPAHGVVNIQVPDAMKGDVTVSLTDCMGREVYKSSLTGNGSEYQIDLTHLPKGFYTIQAAGKGKQVFTKLTLL